MAQTRYDVNGKVVLITGGAQGIGLGLATALHRRGARLALVDLDGKTVAAAAAGFGSDRALGLVADVTNSGAIGDAVATVVDRFGGVDVVVANAGVANTAATTRVMAPEEFERVVEVDLLGVYRTVHAALPQIVARRGQAVLVSSVYAFVNGMLVAPYAVSKAGVEQLGRALRVELANHGASATVAYFGFVDTHMVRKGFDEDPLGQRLERELLPAAITKRITPQQAGEALARAIERRKPRVIAPRYWTAVSLLRGVINPVFDRVTERLPQVQALLREADIEHRLDRVLHDRGIESTDAPVESSAAPIESADARVASYLPRINP
jgi:NAD(P)-dependent dehydrogenase (short-subunit alcohol dehydrogenase family)